MDKERILFGVAYWTANKIGISPTVARIIFIILTLFVGGGIILYLALWILKLLSE